MTAYEVGGPTRFAHQRRGLNKMIATGGKTALLFDPGTGKTATALDYAGLLALKSLTGEARVLVVCPLAAVDTWVQQAEQYVSPQVHFWAEALGGSILQRGEALAARGGQPFKSAKRPSIRHHPRALHHQRAVIWAARGDQSRRPVTATEGPDALPAPRLILEVINIDTLTSRAAYRGGTMADYMIDAIKRYSPDLLIVDESHKIKSATGNASRLLARLTPTVRRRVLLTGTVMPHSPMDVFGQWRFLDPYAFGHLDSNDVRKPATLGGFKARYAITGGYMGKEITGFRNLDEMQVIMARNAAVARKEDALDLPSTTDVIVPVELSAAEKKAYTEMKSDLATQLADGRLATVPNMLTQMLRLRQITSGHLPDGSGNTSVVGRSKVRTIQSIVQDTLAGESRVVVFGYFSREIQMLAEALTNKDTEVMRIEGGTTAEDRMAMRARFGSKDPQRIVMVAQIKTMSLAVNELVTASHCVFASLSQQRDDLVQARDRLNRIGQTKPVTFWWALAPGTVDKVIYQSYLDRSNLENAMLRHIADGSNQGEES